MTERLLQIGTITAAVSALMVAGVFFAFSNFVMPALARLPGADGAAAMNMISVTVVNATFMTLLFGPALLDVILTGASLMRGGGSAGWLTLAATVIYLAGCVLVTIMFNVPLNDALAATVPGAPATITEWQSYVSDWTWWNTVRTIAAAVSGTLFIAAAAADGTG